MSETPTKCPYCEAAFVIGTSSRDDGILPGYTYGSLVWPGRGLERVSTCYERELTTLTASCAAKTDALRTLEAHRKQTNRIRTRTVTWEEVITKLDKALSDTAGQELLDQLTDVKAKYLYEKDRAEWAETELTASRARVKALEDLIANAHKHGAVLTTSFYEALTQSTP